MAERAHSMDSERTRADGSDRVLTLDTRELDVAEGRNEWRSTLGSLYAEMDVDWPATRRGLDAEWGGRPVGDLHVSSIRCDAQTVIRSPAMIASDSCADFLVCVVTDGQVEVQQRGRTATLSGGAFALLDLGAPFVFHAPGTFRQVVVRVPGTLVGRILVDLAQTELPSTTAARSPPRRWACCRRPSSNRLRCSVRPTATVRRTSPASSR